MEDNGMRNILPDKGIWTLEDMATYLNYDAAELQQKLTDKGIKVLAISNRYKHKLISLEAIVNKLKELQDTKQEVIPI